MEYIILFVLILLLVRSMGLFEVSDTSVMYTAQKSEIKHKTIECFIEEHDNQVYLFSKDTDTFIIQGNDLQDVEEKCKQTMPNVTLMVYEKI
jgi:hypothetical protein